MWNAQTGEHVWTSDGVPGHTGGVNSVAWNPDGQFIVSSGDDNKVKVWNARDLMLPYIFQASAPRT